MAFTFDPVFAVDPANSANIAKNATITIFDPADPAQSPIAIMDPTGSPLPNPITVDAAGMGPAYQHPTLARVGWKGAGFVGYFTSYEGMLNETIAAKDAAQAAASVAGTEAIAVVEARLAAGEFKGEKGADGVDGANVLPTQEAIEQALTTAGPAKVALDATIARGNGGRGGAEGFIGKIQQRQSAVVAVLGDSTGNDANEWPRLSLASLGTQYPYCTLTERVWNDATGTYGGPTTVKTGSVTTTQYKDTFTRTGAIIGSKPDIGPAYVNESGANAQYTLDGTSLNFTGTTLASLFSIVPSGAQTVTTDFSFGAAQSNTTLRLYGQYKDGSNYVAIFITFGATITWNITKRVAGAFTTVQTGTANPFAAAGASFTAKLVVNGTALTATVNGQTITGALTEADVTALSTTNPAVGIAFNVVGGKADNIQADVTSSGTATQVALYNGSVPGTPIATSLANLDRGIIPVAPDVVVISHSHNQGTDNPAVFTAKLVELAEAVIQRYPEAGIVLSSQNPRNSPANQIPEHAARLVAIRALASRRGWGYIPVAERYYAQPTLTPFLDADGVHPKHPEGRVLWNDAVMAYYNSLKEPTA